MQIQNDEIKSQAVDEKNQQYNHYRKAKYQHMIDQQVPNKSNPSVSSDASGDKDANVKKMEEQFNFLDNSGPIYLDKTLLNTIVQLCRVQGLVTDDLAHIFFNNHTMTMDKKYIELFHKNRLNQYDFSQCRINIIDHRRLVQMLLNHNPGKYKIFKPPYIPFDFEKSVRQFLTDIYDKPHQYYYTILDKQVNDHYQSWWGGPERMRTIIDPPVKFYESQDGKKLRQQRQNIIRVQSQEEEKDRNKRINQQRATNMDLMDIAKLMTVKLYGKVKDGKQVKRQGSEDNSSVNDDSSVADSHASKGKKSKNKKVKKEKSGKKDKKKKDKEKEKGKKKQKKQKKQKSDKAKQEPEFKRQHKQ